MKQRVAIIAVVAVALVLSGVYFRGRSSVPSGQEPLTVLSRANLSEFTRAFDAASDDPRMLLLLSPT